MAIDSRPVRRGSLLRRRPATIWLRALCLAVSVLCLGIAEAALAEDTSAADLVGRLLAGGYVLVMRHASAPEAKPDTEHADPDNVNRERQLDAAGRDSARAIGEAIRGLHIPVGEILTSPTYRAVETARLQDLSNPVEIPALGDGGQGMQADTEGSRSAWLRERAGKAPPRESNTLIVTQAPNIIGAFPKEAAGIAAGEMLVLHPDGAGAATVVTRVKADDWQAMKPR